MNLTSVELAAWVQAIGSIVAIIAVVLIAVWQANKQHRNALALHREEQRYARIELAKTLSMLAKNCAKAMAYLTRQLSSRQDVYEIAEGQVHFDFGELSRIEASIGGIPLYSLPHSLVTPTMLLSATVRQFREKVEMAIRVHRNMDAAAFEDFFRVLREMNDSLEQTCGDIATEVNRIQSDE
jgi:hypothetical protein